MIFWLLLVGLMAYWVVKQSVGSFTKTSVWVLWLVMMTPALIWTTWFLVHGNDRPLPPALAVVPFLVCPVLYAVLVQWGRSPGESNGDPKGASTGSGESASQGGGGENLPQKDGTPAGAFNKPPTFSTIREALEGKLETKIPRLLDQQEEQRLEACFSWSTFYLRQVEYRPQVAICHGQLRTNAEAAYDTIGKKLSQTFSDRFLLLLQEGRHGKPFFAIVPNPYAKTTSPAHDLANLKDGVKRMGDKTMENTVDNNTVGNKLAVASPDDAVVQQQGRWFVTYQFLIAPLLLMFTLFTTTVMGAEIVNNQVGLQRDWAFLQRGVPYSLALVAIFLAHEGSNYLMALRHRIPAVVPYFIPAPFFLGTFGAFSQLRGPIPHRKALLDLSVVGTLLGLLVALPVLGFGLSQSTLVPLENTARVLNVFNVNALDPRSSLLLLLLSKLTLPSFPAPSQGLALQPLAIAGYVGLWFTTLKLLPIGSLSGGRIIHAMVGQRVGAIVGQVTRLVLLLLSVVRTEFLLVALMLFFVPAGDRPALNDVSPLDNARDFVGLVTLAIAAMVLLPAPSLLVNWLT
ncbi:MAG: site-2 protease family protein [Cyanobacteria bacterium P01_F01_bin.153]